MARVARKTRAALDLCRAAIAVTRARRTVSRRPVGALVTRDETAELTSDAGSLSGEDRRRGERWAVAVDRALRWLPGDRACLVRATALLDLLVRDRAAGAMIRIGVRRTSAGFEAHAWVEQNGTPIAEPDMLRGAFASLEGVTLR